MPPKSVFKVQPKFSSEILNSDPAPVNYADFAKAAYTRGQEVPGWSIDPRFSDRNRTLYYRTRPDGSREGVLANSGTRLYQGRMQAARDLTTDALLAVGLKRLSSRFRGGLRTTKAALDEYGSGNLTLTGHSLGAGVSLHSYDQLRKGADEPPLKVVAFNPGLSPLDARRGQYAMSVADHVFPHFGPARWVYSMARDGPYRLGKNAEVHAVKGDSIAAMTPFLDAENVFLHDKKVRDAHSIDNFISEGSTGEE